MAVVLLWGNQSAAKDFYEACCDPNDENILWVNNQRNFLFHANLIVIFSADHPPIPGDAKWITWSGNHDETLARIMNVLNI
ncbi:MAG: hypothetical protein EBS86_07580 [Crocinitomicaceae bacterium]|nr:hypothetical protein [Crocinitomicaceae bacterium]